MEDETQKKAAAPPAVLRLRGLPFAACEDDIREFFKGFELSSVFLCKRNGRATGEAYVQLASSSGAGEAMKSLNRQNMGHRYIEIFEASEADMNTAKAICMDGRLKGFVVRMRGLPYNSTAADVQKFFEGVDICRGLDGIVFTYTPDGRPTGEAYIEFPTEEAQKEAMKRHKELIGTRYIELFNSTKSDMLQAIQQNKYVLGYANRKRWLAQAVALQSPMAYPDSGMLRLRGAPYSAAGVDEVTNYFRGFSLAPGVQVVSRPDAVEGIPGGGVTYVQLENPNDAARHNAQRGQRGPARYVASIPGAGNSKGVVQQDLAQGPHGGAAFQQAVLHQTGGGIMGPSSGQHGLQPMMQSGDYTSSGATVMIQQPYIMQQPQGVRYDPSWGTVGPMAGMAVPGHQGSAQVMNPWYKGYNNAMPGTGYGGPMTNSGGYAFVRAGGAGGAYVNELQSMEGGGGQHVAVVATAAMGIDPSSHIMQ